MTLEQCYLALENMEDAASNVYKTFSKICAENLKDVIIKLSEEEKNHKRIIYNSFKNIKFKEMDLGSSIDDAFKIQDNYMKVADQNEILSNEKNFFIFALQMEKNSAEIYEELLKLFEQSSEEYANFEMLLNEEKNHMVYVLNELYAIK